MLDLRRQTSLLEGAGFEYKVTLFRLLSTVSLLQPHHLCPHLITLASSQVKAFTRMQSLTFIILLGLQATSLLATPFFPSRPQCRPTQSGMWSAPCHDVQQNLPSLITSTATPSAGCMFSLPSPSPSSFPQTNSTPLTAPTAHSATSHMSSTHLQNFRKESAATTNPTAAAVVVRGMIRLSDDRRMSDLVGQLVGETRVLRAHWDGLKSQ